MKPWKLATLAGLLVGGSVTTLEAQQSGRDEQAIEAGRQLFMRCIACHTRSATARAGTGPHLEGIVGRQVASVPGFKYTAMLKDQSFAWTPQKLDQWLAQPQKHLPSMCIPFAGFSRKADRQALIAYLQSPAT